VTELWAETAALGLRIQESITFGASQHEVTWIRIMDFRIWKDLGTIWMAFGEFPIGLRASIQKKSFVAPALLLYPVVRSNSIIAFTHEAWVQE